MGTTEGDRPLRQSLAHWKWLSPRFTQPRGLLVGCGVCPSPTIGALSRSAYRPAASGEVTAGLAAGHWSVGACAIVNFILTHALNIISRCCWAAPFPS